MRYIKCRDYEPGESFPYREMNQDFYFPCDETLYEYWQPDNIEDDEFNTVIMLKGMPVLVRSYHFEFITKE